MLATPTEGPEGLPSGPEWAYEVKWDGVRVLADTTRGDLRLLSRNGNDVTVAYPELAGLATVPGAVVDGEVVAMVDGAPSFSALAERMHVRNVRRARALAERAPVSYLVFDVLMLRGVDITHRTFDERRATLERMPLPDRAQLSPVYPDGRELWEVTREHGLEGVVAKRRASTYQPGRRSPDWVKAAHRATRTVLVGGWRPERTGDGRIRTPPPGSAPRIGALLLGAPTGDGGLWFVGRAGSGLSGARAADLARLLGPLARPDPPFTNEVPAADAQGAQWCEPVVAVDVAFLARTRDGRLRQPVIRGVRDDAAPDPWEEL